MAKCSGVGSIGEQKHPIRLLRSSSHFVIVVAIGCSSTSPSRVPVCSKPASPSLATLDAPNEFRVHDEWGGLGPSYSLDADFQKIGETYEVECTLRISPYSSDSETIPERFSEKLIKIPRERVTRLVESLRKVTLEPEKPGLIDLAPIDDNGRADLFLSLKEGGAANIHVGPTGSMSVDSDAHYRIKDAAESLNRYHAILDALALQRWIESEDEAGFREAHGGKSRAEVMRAQQKP